MTIYRSLSDRKQCVKIGEHCSSFQKITKGVPRSSILGPLIFNIFLTLAIHTTVVPIMLLYLHDRRAKKRRYPHDREIDIQMNS